MTLDIKNLIKNINTEGEGITIMKIDEAVGEVFSAYYYSDLDAYKILSPITEMLKITGINQDIKNRLHDPNYEFRTGMLERRISPGNVTSGLLIDVDNLISAASRGDVQALYTLARLYSVFGDEGRTMAFKYFETASDMGHADAQYSLYMYYKFGWYVQKSESSASYWLDKAIESGSKDALEEQKMQREGKMFRWD